MTAASLRVRHIVELVDELTEDVVQLDAELLVQDPSVEQAWADEIDRRAARAIRGEGAAASRAQLDALLEKDAEDARAKLLRLLPSGR